MATAPQGFSLPPELEREIFEVTGIRFPAFIPTLLRVCHRVHVWIEPLLYRVLVVSQTGLVNSASLSSLVESKSPLLQNAVRHIFIETYTFSPTYTSLLAACPGCINLSIDGELHPDFLPAVDKMRPLVLAFTMDKRFFTADLGGFAHPLFESVTHLDLYHGIAPDANWETWSGLASLPVLTHLALSLSIARGILSQVMAECSKLLIAIVPTYDDAAGHDTAVAFVCNLGLTDARVVVMALDTSYQVDWELGVRGSEDFWMRAERFVKRKRAGQIEVGCYVLDETATATNSS